MASVWDIVRRLERITGRPIEVRRDAAPAADRQLRFAATGKFTNHTGWRPKTSLDDGLALRRQRHSSSWGADRPAG